MPTDAQECAETNALKTRDPVRDGIQGCTVHPCFHPASSGPSRIVLIMRRAHLHPDPQIAHDIVETHLFHSFWCILIFGCLRSRRKLGGIHCFQIQAHPHLHKPLHSKWSLLITARLPLLLFSAFCHPLLILSAIPLFRVLTCRPASAIAFSTQATRCYLTTGHAASQHSSKASLYATFTENDYTEKFKGFGNVSNRDLVHQPSPSYSSPTLSIESKTKKRRVTRTTAVSN